MIEENIDGPDIYWFVTMDKTNNDLPGYVEELFIQKYLINMANYRHGINIFTVGARFIRAPEQGNGRGTVHPCPE